MTQSGIKTRNFRRWQNKTKEERWIRRPGLSLLNWCNRNILRMTWLLLLSFLFNHYFLFFLFCIVSTFTSVFQKRRGFQLFTTCNKYLLILPDYHYCTRENWEGRLKNFQKFISPLKYTGHNWSKYQQQTLNN